jgi:hypothetical protein
MGRPEEGFGGVVDNGCEKLLNLMLELKHNFDLQPGEPSENFYGNGPLPVVRRICSGLANSARESLAMFQEQVHRRRLRNRKER